VEKIIGKLAILEIVLFDELSNKQRATGRVADVYKAVSRPRVDKSLEWDFIKVILTKDQERDKGYKE